MAKSGGAPQFSIASYRLISALCCLPLLFYFPIPLADSWAMLLLSTVVHTAYYFTLSKSYRSGDLSQVYPLFRGLAPVLVVLGAAVFANEYLSPGAMLGIGVVSIGLISITFAGGAFGKIPPLALRWGLAPSVLIAAYTVADGTACVPLAIPSVISCGCLCWNRFPSACGCWRKTAATGFPTCGPSRARSASVRWHRQAPTRWSFTPWV